jgi:mono/diheme cytochrome c family protein
VSHLAIAWGDLWPPTVRHLVIGLNLAALVGLAVYAIYALRGTKHDEPSQNLTPYIDDDKLEGPRLERVQGWALLFAAIVAVALPAYWLREPTRQDDADRTFSSQAEERGLVLFSNKLMDTYDSASSLGCADCHGVDGGGGAARSVQLVDGEKATVSWRAPALNTVLYRFSPEEVTQILTYGRPGTPMGAWGVAGGGPKNEQSIQDLVAYLISIQLTPEEAQQKSTEALEAWREQPQANLEAAQKGLADDQKAYDDAVAARDALGADATELEQFEADKAVELAQFNLDDAETDLANAEEWVARRQDVTDGQLLFEVNCARCHTKGWSYWDITQALPEDVIGLPGGGGQNGFALRDGATVRRFPDDPETELQSSDGCGEGDVEYDSEGLVIDPKSGCASQAAFVVNGSERQVAYGSGGIGNGGMPGQCNVVLRQDADIELEHYGCMLTSEQITAIVEYERSLLDETTAELETAGTAEGAESE